MGHLHRRRVAALAVAAVAILLLPGCASDLGSRASHASQVSRLRDGSAPIGSFEALMRMGEAARRAGDPALAAMFFQRAHEMEPARQEPLVKMGSALSDLGAHDEAEGRFREALALGPKNPEALRGLGAAYLTRRQPEAAIEQFRAALAIDPEDFRSFNGMGVATDQLGDHEAAQQYYQAGLSNAPNNLTLLNNLGLSKILSRDFAGAVEVLSQAVQLPGAGARQRQNLALAYGLAGQTDVAEQIARIDLDPQSVKNNLAYYATLRAADDRTLVAAVLGLRDGPTVQAQSERKFAEQAPNAPLSVIAGDEPTAEPPAGPATDPAPPPAPRSGIEPILPPEPVRPGRVPKPAAVAQERAPPEASPTSPIPLEPAPPAAVSGTSVPVAPIPDAPLSAGAPPMEADPRPAAIPVAGTAVVENWPLTIAARTPGSVAGVGPGEQFPSAVPVVSQRRLESGPFIWYAPAQRTFGSDASVSPGSSGTADTAAPMPEEQDGEIPLLSWLVSKLFRGSEGAD